MNSALELPKLKGTPRFEYITGGAVLTVVFWENKERVEIQYRRIDRRWRYYDGAYVSVHAIAASIFSYRENPSFAEIKWMSGYVENVGTLIDLMSNVIDDRVAQRLEEDAIDRARQFLARHKSTQGDTKPVYLYLMRHSNGLIKIGRSTNPRTREKTLQAEDPRLQMIFYCEAKAHVERRLHKIFHRARVRGEWFDLESHHIDWIIFVVEKAANAPLADVPEHELVMVC